MRTIFGVRGQHRKIEQNCVASEPVIKTLSSAQIESVRILKVPQEHSSTEVKLGSVSKACSNSTNGICCDETSTSDEIELTSGVYKTSIRRKRSRQCKCGMENQSIPGCSKRTKLAVSLDGNALCHVNDVASKIPYTQVPSFVEVDAIEDDERFLHHLRVRHGNQIGEAKFMLLTHLSRKKSLKSLKCRHKHVREKGGNIKLQSLANWRERYDRERCNFPLLGDLRQQATYEGQIRNGKSSGQDTDSTWQNIIMHDSDEARRRQNRRSERSILKNKWDYILCAAESMIHHASHHDEPSSEMRAGLKLSWDPFPPITSSSIHDGRRSCSCEVVPPPKPMLRDLFDLLDAAYDLPIPEQGKGTDEVLIQRTTQCLESLLCLVCTGRYYLAFIRDASFESILGGKYEGICINSLRSAIDLAKKLCPVNIEEISTLEALMKKASQWESRVEAVMKAESKISSSSSGDILFSYVVDITDVESLLTEAEQFSFRLKSMSLLEDRLNRARELRKRICEWMANVEGRKESIEMVGSLMKELNSIGILFDEARILAGEYKKGQAWIERATSALKNRASLIHIKELIEFADSIPFNISEILCDLRSKMGHAYDWIEKFFSLVCCPYVKNEDFKSSYSNLIGKIRSCMAVGAGIQQLEMLRDEGMIVPIDMDQHKLLSIEIKAHYWGMATKKIITDSLSPSYESKTCIEKLRTHLGLISEMRNQLPVGLKSEWCIESECKLNNFVKVAETVLSKCEALLEHIKSTKQTGPLPSIKSLHDIANEVKSISIALGSAGEDVLNLKHRADKWTEQNCSLLFCCRIAPLKNSENSVSHRPHSLLSLSKLNNAVLTASKEIGIELAEVAALRDLIDRINCWSDRAAEFAPKRKSQRSNRSKVRTRHGIKELVSLIDEASSFPVNLDSDLQRLRFQLSDVESWRLQAQIVLKQIAEGFKILRHARAKQEGVEDTGVFKLIKDLLKSLHCTGIYTAEEEAAKNLKAVGDWCSKASLILPEEVFGTSLAKEFDGFIKQGTELLLNANDYGDELLSELQNSWRDLMNEDLVRLRKHQTSRDNFYAWRKSANSFLSSKDKNLMSSLKLLHEQSKKFPASIDVVRQIVNDYEIAQVFLAETKEVLTGKSKITENDLKLKVRKWESLKLECPEVKSLQKHIRIAHRWALRVKKSGIEDGSASISNLNLLIQEYEDEDFLVAMPTEYSKLKQATCDHCLCRQPHEGFMIECDFCGEWYHGSCVGVTKARAERREKYTCVRCVVVNKYKDSAKSALRSVRKWSNANELRKARQTENQKHQRKVRKEERDIEVRTNDADEILCKLAKLAKLQNGISEISSALNVVLTNNDSTENCAMKYQPGINGTLNNKQSKEREDQVKESEYICWI
mmetsp:Transcript_50414/g.58846  ORF Transcript_50414/g.58846 Transcript_50414/m.58846 type:complete len:1381 (-) Transcript_50414:477-4619(-)